MNSEAVSAGKMTVIRMLAQRAVQVNTGIFMRFMPGQRILRMVTIRFTAESVVPTPAICNAHM